MENTDKLGGFTEKSTSSKRATWCLMIPCGLFAMTLMLSCNRGYRTAKESKTNTSSLGTQSATPSSIPTEKPIEALAWEQSIKTDDHFYRCSVHTPRTVG